MQHQIIIEHSEAGSALLGVLNGHSEIIDEAFGISSETSADGICLDGPAEAVQKAAHLYGVLQEILAREGVLHPQTVHYLVQQARDGQETSDASYRQDMLGMTAKGRPIRPKTKGQRLYVDAMETKELCFAIGPAGTGKTYLAVALAVKAFKAQEISRIILTRPAVEAGEKLGFLPGDLHMKVDPYMRPLNDALHELMGAESYARCLERGQIEISPLAYMRGRTLDNAFIILDEAQNTSEEQMKMFLTRIGYHSRTVVTGDITQIDLPGQSRSGLASIRRILEGVEGVGFVRLSDADVVRNPLVQRIIKAYATAQSPQTKRMQRRLP